MLKTTATFETYNALPQKKPVFVLWIYNESSSAFLTRKYSTGTFGDITTDYKKTISSVRTESLAFEPAEDNINPGSIEIRILDAEANFLTQANTDQFYNRRCKILYGFQQINIADFATIGDYYIQEIKWDGKVVIIIMRDVTSNFSKRVLRKFGKTKSRSNASIGDSTIDVDSITSFNLPVDTTDGYSAWGDSNLTTRRSHAAIIMFGKETQDWIRYHDLSANTIKIGPSIGLTSNFGNPRVIREQFYCTSFFYGSLIMQLLTTTASGLNGDWDIGIGEWGVEIPEDLVDFIQIMNECYERYCKWAETYANETPFAFIKLFQKDDTSKLTGFDIFGELLPVLPAKFIITGEGKLGVKLLDVFTDNEGMCDIGDDDLAPAGRPIISADRSSIINQVELTDWAQQSQNCEVDEDLYKKYVAGLVSKYGENNTKSIKVYQSEYPNTLQRDRILHRIFGVLGETITRLTLPLKMKHIVLQPGDKVNVTLSSVVDVLAGTYGISNRCFQVIRNGVRFSDGQAYCEAELFNIDMNKKVTSVSIVKVYDEDDIDTAEALGDARKELTEDADVTESLEAEDGFIDLAGSDFALWIGVYFRLTLPAEAGGVQNAYITVHIHTQDVAGTDDHTVEKRIYYDETASGEQITDLYLVFDVPAHQPVRVKVDWESHSGTFPPTKVEAIAYKTWYFNAITSEVIH